MTHAGPKARARAHRQPRLATTTSAIRKVLALSAAALALSGSGVALAGTCVETGTNTVSCNGIFTDTVTDAIPAGDVVPDLTVVIGDAAPTSVFPASGSVGVEASWGGDVTVINYADISTDAADGIHAYGNESSTLHNYGDIHTLAGAYYANAVDFAAQGDVTIVNGGSVQTVSTDYQYALAMTASSAAGDVHIENQAGAQLYAYGLGSAKAVRAFAAGDASFDNAGTVTAVAAYYAAAASILAIGDASLANSEAGAITADGQYASAVIVDSRAATATVDNAGYVGASGFVAANGVIANAYDAVYLSNSGEVVVDSYDGHAVALRALGTGDDAHVEVSNSGSLQASSLRGFAAGISANSQGDAIVANSGQIGAYTPYGDAGGILARIYDGLLLIDNSGAISVTATTGGGVGINTFAVGSSDASVYNSGEIHVSALGNASGISGGTSGGELYVYNAGLVDVSGAFVAYGIELHDKYGDVGVVNVGDIEVASEDFNALGIFATTNKYAGIDIRNDGSIHAINEGDYAATGVLALAGDGDIAVANGGDIHAEGEHFGFGLDLNTEGGGIGVLNDGNILAEGVAGAYGMDLSVRNGGGNVTVANAGGVAALSVDGDAIAVRAQVWTGDFYLYNDGLLSAYSLYGDAYGVQATVLGVDASATVVNAGSIEASSVYGDAIGVQLDSSYGAVDLDNSGSIAAAAGDAATAVYLVAYGTYGQATAYNGGTIYAAGRDYGTGLLVRAGKYAGLTNAGDIYASATAVNYATGAVGAGIVSFYGDAQLHNSGSIAAVAYSELSSGTAVGAFTVITGGNALLENAGTITAYASGYFDAHATGVAARSLLLSATVYNSGSVGAEAYGMHAYAIGADVISGESAAVNTTAGSSIVAIANGYADAVAHGAQLNGLFANVYGEGAIAAAAYADAAIGDARAYAAYAYGSFTGIYNLGEGELVAVAAGSYALAVGAFQDGYFTAFHNEGEIYAHASGETGFAIGAMTLGYYGEHLYNDGGIHAVAEGEGVQATGLFAYSRYGDVDLYNTGTISATAGDMAVAVQLRSYTATYIYNSGDIVASGGATNLAIYSSGDSADTIYNYGTITGAIRTGAGDDFLYNSYYGGVWNATGYSSFGDGDDVILNWGTINMTDAVIDLGYHNVYGNYFLNYGTLHVDGDNAIYMGHGALGGGTLLPTAIPSANPNAFYNGGVIDFQDGAADDYLLIVGDFAGYGQVNFDVDMDAGTADQLYIDGSVVYDSQNTVNVYVTDLNEAIVGESVPLIYVSGDSVADNFVLGDVGFDVDNSFVTLGFDLIADIDESNAEPDTWSLGIVATGLTDVGTLAASVAPSVQSLMNTQVGTWRQRMGVIDRFNKGAIALWARIFTDKGSFSPEHQAANFGNGGNFDWDQKNSGAEAGIDFSVTDEFSIGLLVAKSKAETDLDDPGVGHNEIDAETWGLYGTWISPNGFYLDASYRWMDFDVDLSSSAGVLEGDGSAEAFNIEAGYAWTLSGGLQIEPQLQYTKTNVDELSVLTTVNGMTFTSDGGDSSRGRLGVALRKAFGDADTGWLWTPYVTLSAVREFDGETQYAVNHVLFGETDIEGTSALVELGFTARHQNWAVYGGLNWADGGALNSFFGGQLGVRYTFGGPAPAPAPVAPPPAKTCAELDDDGDGINNCDDKCLGSTAGQAVGPDGCPVPAPEPVMEPKPYRN